MTLVLVTQNERIPPISNPLPHCSVLLDTASVIWDSWCGELGAWYGSLAVKTIIEHQGLPGYAKNSNRRPSTLQGTASFVLHKLSAIIIDDTTGNNGSLNGAAGRGLAVHCLTDALDALFALLDKASECIAKDPFAAGMFASLAAHAFNALLHADTATYNGNVSSGVHVAVEATWQRALHIQYNVSRLDEWCSKGHPELLASLRTAFAPLLQATKLLQLAKTLQGPSDLPLIAEACPSLTLVQIRHILGSYVPDVEWDTGPVNEDLLAALDAWRADLNMAAAVSKSTFTSVDTLGNRDARRPGTPPLDSSLQQTKLSARLALDTALQCPLQAVLLTKLSSGEDEFDSYLKELLQHLQSAPLWKFCVLAGAVFSPSSTSQPLPTVTSSPHSSKVQ